MKIAHLLPHSAHFPLTRHNGRYEWVLRLASLQVSQGHQVTIFAGPDSSGGAEGLEWRSHNEVFKDSTVNNLANIRLALNDSGFDIYHSHFDFLHYFLAGLTAKPFVFTQHWFPNADTQQAARYDTKNRVLAVPVTKFMADKNQELAIVSTKVIYHGIDLDLFRYAAQPASGRYVFVGRITPAKGVKEAVELARAAHIQLDIIGKVNASDQAYWDTILPMVDGEQVRYLGPKTQPEVAGLLAVAPAMIFPVKNTEAFGQTIVEAQACGTPVITQAMGAAHELVQHAKTGFVVSSSDEYLEAIKAIGSLSRADCRAFAERFDVNVMARNYQELYKKLVA